MFLALFAIAAITQPQVSQAMRPQYHWEPVAVCPRGAVLARLPIYPGRLGLLQDLGCNLDFIDIDGRSALFREVTTPRFTTQKLALWHVPLEWETGWRGFGLCNAQGCIQSVLPVVEIPYPKSEITVAKKFMAPPPAEEERIKRDRIHIAQANTHELPEQLFGWPWVLPRPANYTSVFGAQRVINNKSHTRHLGTDFDGKVGEPIKAAQDGVVVLAEDLFYSGNSVFVSHGLGIYTTYFHMTKIATKVGQLVRAGELLGTIGRTGRVTGPHLHFSTKLWGHHFEPMELFELDTYDSGVD